MLGNDWEPSDRLVNELEKFLCNTYGYPRMSSINQIRSTMLNKMVGSKTDIIIKKANVDLSKLPPCLSSLRPHVNRANYKVAFNKMSHIAKPCLPLPEGKGWIKEGQSLQPLWSDGPILPASLVDIISERENDTSDDEEEDRYNDSYIYIN
ncbi:MAG: hypothetical protein GY928_19035 [Colwellia sp.]|nr:hypothetical protein [Colwellia sp.]